MAPALATRTGGKEDRHSPPTRSAGIVRQAAAAQGVVMVSGFSKGTDMDIGALVTPGRRTGTKRGGRRRRRLGRN